MVPVPSSFLLLYFINQFFFFSLIYHIVSESQPRIQGHDQYTEDGKCDETDMVFWSDNLQFKSILHMHDHFNPHL